MIEYVKTLHDIHRDLIGRFPDYKFKFCKKFYSDGFFYPEKVLVYENKFFGKLIGKVERSNKLITNDKAFAEKADYYFEFINLYHKY